MSEPATNEDVLRFLEELDSFTPAQKTANQQPNAQELSGAGASVTPQDALTFLNELETPEASARPPAVANDPAASKPAIVPLQESPQTGIHPSPPPSAPFASEPWGWNTLWSQAARVGITATTSLTKGLESAKSIAEETAKAVVESENVKGIINREHLARLGTDISRLTHKLVDTVAPPLPNSPPTPLFADDITLYYSSPADEDLGSLRDFMLATIEEMWVGRVCRRVFIAGREGEQILASNAEEIAKVIEATLLRLQQLHTSTHHSPTTINTPVFLIIQPHICPISDSHIQYYLRLIAGNLSVSILSQSTLSRAVDDDGAVSNWSKHQRKRVLETAVSDICEEFVVLLYGKRSNQ